MGKEGRLGSPSRRCPSHTPGRDGLTWDGSLSTLVAEVSSITPLLTVSWAVAAKGAGEGIMGWNNEVSDGAGFALPSWPAHIHRAGRRQRAWFCLTVGIHIDICICMLVQRASGSRSERMTNVAPPPQRPRAQAPNYPSAHSSSSGSPDKPRVAQPSRRRRRRCRRPTPTSLSTNPPPLSPPFYPNPDCAHPIKSTLTHRCIPRDCVLPAARLETTTTGLGLDAKTKAPPEANIALLHRAR